MRIYRGAFCRRIPRRVTPEELPISRAHTGQKECSRSAHAVFQTVIAWTSTSRAALPTADARRCHVSEPVMAG